jgi:UDP-N-acetylmuramyl-tripeptide synthetase|tara:strand:- start:5541 stop:7007 length:1467 start_codon:yes stop_codon:yes gene_type:complete
MNKLESILNINFPKDTKIAFATNSSSEVIKNSIFFGLPGTKNHGSKYCKKAIDLGASLAVHNDPDYDKGDINIFYIKDLEEKITSFLNALYGVELHNNNFFSFTGTNGKTSSAYLCHQLLINQGHESLYIGTLGVKYNQENINTTFSSKTTPDIFELFYILSHFKLKDAINICIEISSHALDQGRLKNLDWLKSASILNITNDHIDYHKNIEAYIDAKFEIFRFKSLVNFIDEASYKFSKNYDFIQNNQSKLSVISEQNKFSDIFYKINEISTIKTTFEIIINKQIHGDEEKDKEKYEFSCNIFPEFNVQNLVFAICSIGFDGFKENYINDLEFLKLPKGRSEIIKNIPSNIIIDYAHNFEAINYFLSSIKKYYENLIVIMGCGGDRDKLKRSKMLNAALQNSSEVIFTSDNSRSEDFEDIFKDAAKNNNIENVVKIKDRREAILFAVKRISDNDCIVILGKGHEDIQEENNKTIFFSDHEVVNEIYK